MGPEPWRKRWRAQVESMVEAKVASGDFSRVSSPGQWGCSGHASEWMSAGQPDLCAQLCMAWRNLSVDFWLNEWAAPEVQRGCKGSINYWYLGSENVTQQKGTWRQEGVPGCKCRGLEAGENTREGDREPRAEGAWRRKGAESRSGWYFQGRQSLDSELPCTGRFLRDGKCCLVAQSCPTPCDPPGL